MPMINIEYDDKKVSENKIQLLSEAVQEIVSEVTEIKDVFVYANTAKIKVQIAPIEIFVEMSAQKINNLDELTEKIKVRIKNWKSETEFNIPINLTVIPMNWKVEVEI